MIKKIFFSLNNDEVMMEFWSIPLLFDDSKFQYESMISLAYFLNVSFFLSHKIWFLLFGNEPFVKIKGIKPCKKLVISALSNFQMIEGIIQEKIFEI